MRVEPLESDPFDWSLEEVVDYLCHDSFGSWARSKSSLPRPDPAHLESVLRENDVTGEVLLTEVTKSTLLEEFGLKSLGQRATIFKAVRYLQNVSPKYKENVDRVGVVEPSPSPFLTFSTPAQTPQNSVQLSSLPQPSHYSEAPICDSPVSPQKPASTSLANSSTRDEKHAFSNQPSTNVAEGGFRLPTIYDVSADGLHSVPKDSKYDEPNLRPNERYVVDTKGKRRRRALPTLVTGPDQHSSKVQDHKGWYLGPNRLMASDVFYRDTEVNDNDDYDTDEFVFAGMSNDFPAGSRLFAKKRMQHYLQQRPRHLNSKDGKPAHAIFPYPNTVLPSGHPQHFTMFCQDGKKVNVTKEDIFDWPELGMGADRLHWLLSKYPPKNEHDALPVYGDSASEGEYDSDTWREMESENQEKAEASLKGAKFLEHSEVDDIVSGCIVGFVDKWTREKLSALKPKARAIWLRSRNKRRADIKTASNKVAHLNLRLKKLGEAVKVSPWSRVKDVQQQCQAMEQTVFERERQKWVINVLQAEECPPKPADGAVVNRPRQKRPTGLADEESLGSDTSCGTDDFIVPDETRESIPDKFPTTDIPTSTSITALEHSGSESDVISPTKRKRPRKGDIRELPESEHFVNPAPPSPTSPVSEASAPPQRVKPKLGKELHLQDIDIVDLTRCDEESDTAEPKNTAERDFEVHTPPLNPVDSAIKKPLPSVEADHSDLNETASQCDDGDLDIEEISNLTWGYLETHKYRTRLLAKLLYSISTEECRELEQLIESTRSSTLRKNAAAALKGLLSRFRGPLTGVSERATYLYKRIATFYISWVHCYKVDGKGIPKQYIESAIKKKMLRRFFKRLSVVIKSYAPYSAVRTKRQSKGPSSPGPAKVRKTGSLGKTINLDDSDDCLPGASAEAGLQEAIHHTPHKKRKRAVKESQETMDTQRNAQLRLQIQEQQQKRLSHKLERLGVANSDPERQVVSFDEPIIHLDPHIGRRVKPHQLSGIQFMWRELIKDEIGQGCLLAHTMGLGKTMQVISLLVTIATAASSPDPGLRNQVPERLRESRTLILCPSSLVENWWEEFMMWLPQHQSTRESLGPLRKFRSALQTQRLEDISSWYSEGGILLMSYDMFRIIVLNRATKLRPSPLPAAIHERVKMHLLEGPNIVVADEAHKMKNKKSGIALASGAFQSKSRIALTGSPLANNLGDYYAMIDWIAPGYLGTEVQFKAKYVEPISEGLYAESSQYERRKSMKRLLLLKKDLEPKIHRADISVLAGSLPPKVEFVIVVPLAPLQEQAYRMFVASLLPGRGDDVVNTCLWSWLAILSLLCNHPACFVKKLQQRGNGGKKQKQIQPDSEVDSFPEDTPVSDTLSQELISALKQVFDPVEELNAPRFSPRAELLVQIIQGSIDAGDRLLVFSHSIPTLDYVEEILKQNGWDYNRLDGLTPIMTRQTSTKSFNQSDSKKHVYLISTRAGGLGLNIPGANRVILFDFNFNPTWEEQAVGRAYRLGQQKPVFVYRFVSGGTYEEVVYNKTVFKTQLSSRVVDKKNPVRSATKSAKDYLFSPKEVKQKDLSEFKGKDPEVLDKIMEQPNFIRSIFLTETFQREDSDKLTPEEEIDVQAELDDERLKRDDYAAWERKHMEREMKLAAARQNQQPQPIVGMGHNPLQPPQMPPLPAAGHRPAVPQTDGPSAVKEAEQKPEESCRQQ